MEKDPDAKISPEIRSTQTGRYWNRRSHHSSVDHSVVCSCSSPETQRSDQCHIQKWHHQWRQMLPRSMIAMLPMALGTRQTNYFSVSRGPPPRTYLWRVEKYPPPPACWKKEPSLEGRKVSLKLNRREHERDPKLSLCSREAALS